jgi:16S rRNA processing protein RimM
MLAKETWVPLADVARPHGVHGELRLRPFNRDSTLLLELDEVLVRGLTGEEHGLCVERARWSNGAILMKLSSVDDRDRADELRGAHVCARRGDFPPLEAGEFYVCDVEGARVIVAGEGGAAETELGRVKELRNYPSVDVLVVDAADGGPPWEVPLVDAVVASVDTQANLITLASLQGVERA